MPIFASMEQTLNEKTIIQNLMTVAQFADDKKVTRRTVYNWIDDKKVLLVDFMGKKWVDKSTFNLKA